MTLWWRFKKLSDNSENVNTKIMGITWSELQSICVAKLHKSWKSLFIASNFNK